MKNKTSLALILLKILSWILFIGLCLQAGIFLFNVIIAFFQPIEINKFWMTNGLRSLYAANQSHFITLTSLMTIVAVLKALLFYIIVKIFHDKRINFECPFQLPLGNHLSLIAYLTLGIGLFSAWAENFVNWLIAQNIEMPSLQTLEVEGADIWLFMCVILFVVAQIFKKGIEIQSENELTV